jgi:hypothetical protein
MRREESEMADQQTSRVDDAGTTDAAIRSRVDELIAAMTTAEKAGQLTQYFCRGFQRELSTDFDPATGDESQPGKDRRCS